MRVELGFDNSLCLVDIERLELRITGFTDADYGNVLRYDPEITFWHEHRLSGSIVGGNPQVVTNVRRFCGVLGLSGPRRCALARDAPH
jgi:hypothetical protein